MLVCIYILFILYCNIIVFLLFVIATLVYLLLHCIFILLLYLVYCYFSVFATLLSFVCYVLLCIVDFPLYNSQLYTSARPIISKHHIKPCNIARLLIHAYDYNVCVSLLLILHWLDKLFNLWSSRLIKLEIV